MSKVILPGLIFTVSGADVNTEKGLFIKHDGSVCGAGDTALGISYDEADENGDLAVVLDGIVEVQAGGSISAGEFVKSDANGKAVAAEAGDTALGYALEDGSDGVTVLVKIMTVALNAAAEAAEETPAETPADPGDNPGGEDPQNPGQE